MLYPISVIRRRRARSRSIRQIARTIVVSAGVGAAAMVVVVVAIIIVIDEKVIDKVRRGGVRLRRRW